MEVYFEILIVSLIGIVISASVSLCPEGERFSLCDNNECRPTCRLLRGSDLCDAKCLPGCICKKGLVRRETDRKCVTLEECPSYRPLRTRRYIHRRRCLIDLPIKPQFQAFRKFPAGATCHKVFRPERGPNEELSTAVPKESTDCKELCSQMHLSSAYCDSACAESEASTKASSFLKLSSDCMKRCLEQGHRSPIQCHSLC